MPVFSTEKTISVTLNVTINNEVWEVTFQNFGVHSCFKARNAKLLLVNGKKPLYYHQVTAKIPKELKQLGA